MSATDQDKKSTRQVDFEKNLEKLERVIAKLEEGDLPLEESVKQFEQGMKFLKDCRKALGEAEQKVKILVKKNDDFQMEDFEEPEDK